MRWTSYKEVLKWTALPSDAGCLDFGPKKMEAKCEVFSVFTLFDDGDRWSSF